MLRDCVKLHKRWAAGISGNSRKARSGRWRHVAVSALMVPGATFAAQPQESPRYAQVDFDSRFLFGTSMDLSRFSQGNAVLPGVYVADVKVNGQRAGTFEVQFQAVNASGFSEPCFSQRDLEQLGVDTSRLPAAKPGDSTEGQRPVAELAGGCKVLSAAVPGARADMNLGDLQLDISVPQAFMHTRVRGWVDPARWDDGVTVGLLDYSLNGYSSRTNNGGGQFSNLYLGLTSGVNLGPWRLRQRSTKSWSNQGNSSWDSLETYAQRGIAPWRGQLVLGDSNTSGELFDTSSLRGVRLFTDDRMLPESMRSYAPVVRGIADTNAVVTVRQGGRVIHEQNVPAGPFEFSDVPAAGYGGDLQVTIQEADGRQSSFSVPFSTVPLLLRQGVHRYSAGVGKYRNAEFDSEPWMFEGTYQYGVTDGVTAYIGTQASEGYASLMLGSALNSPVGAFSLDVTGARTQVDGTSHTGVSTRLNYANILQGTGTRFSMAGYRYSTSNFYSLRDAIYARAGRGDSDSNYAWNDYRVKERFQVNVSQPVSKRGNVFVTGSSQNYWRGDSGHDLQFQVGYSGGYRQLTYAVYAQRSRSGQSGSLGNQVMLTLSIPLGRNAVDSGPGFNSLSTSVARGSHGDHLVQASANGSGGVNHPVSFGLTATTAQSEESSASTNTLGAYGTYRAPFGTYTANASVGNRTKQMGLGARGSVVAHAGGVTAGPSLGRAAALVQAKGATGARLINGHGAKINANGYALVPTLSPYRVNHVMLDPSNVGMDVELANTAEEVVPTLDSVVLVEMRTTQGKPVLLRLRREDGDAVPLGADVFQEEGGRALGTVGQGGAALVRGLAEQGAVQVRWGEGPDQQCRAEYRLPAEAPATQPSSKADANSIVRIQAPCHTTGPVAQTVPDKAG
ncbi:fimbria/pilus outer membrane usher protein [Achromobacter sp.]|uniref:fimbria/pilus outer membrane usher protein n=1 Tax=Achromobacter sp. TaxID=134375 RepID=UPI0028AB572A|nr:fimbria/pilus outer membrane usher protein [Achromobacter sp.]